MAKWYYYNENGQVIGPIRGRDLIQLVREGTVTQKTKVINCKGRTACAGNVIGLPFPDIIVSDMLVSETSGSLELSENFDEQNFERTRTDTECCQEQEKQEQLPRIGNTSSAPDTPNDLSVPLDKPLGSDISDDFIAAALLSVQPPKVSRALPSNYSASFIKRVGTSFGSYGWIIDICSRWCQRSIVAGLCLVIVGGIVWTHLPAHWKPQVDGAIDQIRITIDELGELH